MESAIGAHLANAAAAGACAPFTWVHRQHIVDVVGRHRLPAMYGSEEAVESGGLVSYAAGVPEVLTIPKPVLLRADRLIE